MRSRTALYALPRFPYHQRHVGHRKMDAEEDAVPVLDAVEAYLLGLEHVPLSRWRKNASSALMLELYHALSRRAESNCGRPGRRGYEEC